MKKIILPYAKPQITSYPAIAYLLSIIENDVNTHEWIYSHYIQIVNKDFEESDPIRGTFTDDIAANKCPFIKMQYLKKEEMLNIYGTFKKFATCEIENGKYIVINCDHYYIPCSAYYKKAHVRHELFIYGVDIEKEIFYVADFFKNSKYSFEEVPCNNVEEAFIGFEKIKKEFDNFEIIMDQKLSNTYFLDIQKIRNDLVEYIDSSSCSKRFGRNVVAAYGISYYKAMKKHCVANIMDIREAYVLYDHKRIMVNRLKYLKQIYKTNLFDGIINEFLILGQKLYLLMMLYLKYSLINDHEILLKIKFLIDIIEDKDFQATYKLIENLRTII